MVPPVDGGMVRDAALGEQTLGALQVLPRDLEGVVALAQRVLDQREGTGDAVGLARQAASKADALRRKPNPCPLVFR